MKAITLVCTFLACCFYVSNLAAQQAVHQWTISQPIELNDEAYDVIAGQGLVYLVKGGAVERYSAQGTLLWTTGINNYAEESGYNYNMQLAPLGGVVFVPEFAPQGIQAISPSGQLSDLFSIENLPLTGSNFIFNPSGDYLLNGGQTSNTNHFISKFNASGLQWSTQVLTRQNNQFITGLAADAGGNVFVSGTTTGVVGTAKLGNVDSFLIKLTNSGDTVWKKQFQFDPLGNVPAARTSFADIMIDPAGNILTAGATGSPSNVLINKFDNDGNLLWSKLLSSPSFNSGADFLDLDAAGNIFFVGKDQLTEQLMQETYLGMLNSAGDLLFRQVISSDDSFVLTGFSYDENRFYVSGNSFAAQPTSILMSFAVVPECSLTSLALLGAVGLAIWLRIAAR